MTSQHQRKAGRKIEELDFFFKFKPVVHEEHSVFTPDLTATMNCSTRGYVGSPRLLVERDFLQ